MSQQDPLGLQNRETSSTGAAQCGMITSQGDNTQLICTRFHPDLWIHQHLEPGNPNGAATAPHQLPMSTVPHTVSRGEKQEHPQELPSPIRE